MSCAECNCIEVGDIVRHKMNAGVVGIVIGFSGSLIYIRVSPSLATLAFHEWELDLVDDEAPPAPHVEADNVVHVDFTKGRVLTPDTDTEGAA